MSHDLEKFLSEVSYTTPEQRQEKINQSVYKDRLEVHSGYNRDEFFSVRDKSTKTHYNVHRGSTTQEDWLVSDKELALNKLEDTARFRRASRMSFNATDRYASGKFGDKADRVVEVGHSLGGALAEHIALKQGHESVVFNQGTTPLRDYREIDRNKHVHHRAEHDVVSSFDNNTGTLVTADKNKGNPIFQSIQLGADLAGSPLQSSLAGAVFNISGSLLKAATSHSLDAI